MRRAVAVLALLCTCAGAISADEVSIRPRYRRSAPGSADATIRVSTSLVLIPAIVTDSGGRSVAGLSKEHFRLYQGGVLQEIATFEAEDSPVSLGLVVDTSNSMTPDFDRCRVAVEELLKTCSRDDEFFVVTFGAMPVLMQRFTTDQALIESQLAAVRPRGATALIDAVYTALHHMKLARHARKALLVISDGNDNNSRYSEEELREFVREREISIFAISVCRRGKRDRGSSLLRELSRETAGLHFAVHDIEELPEAADRISSALRWRYLLGYYPKPAGGAQPELRKVDLVVRPPAGMPEVSAAWRSEYFAPFE